MADPPKPPGEIIDLNADEDDPTSLASYVRRKTAGARKELHADDKTIIITVGGSAFCAGLFGFYEGQPILGAIFTFGGLFVMASVSPFIRERLPTVGRPALWAVAIMTWLLLAANIGFAVYDHFWPKPEGATGSAPPERWPALTSTEASALASRVKFIPPEDIVVACETINCRDLADGIAGILQKTPGWKVSILHRGGFDITGVSGIRLNPNEPATAALQDAIEATTGLAVTLGPDTRKAIGTSQSFLVVGTRPF